MEGRRSDLLLGDRHRCAGWPLPGTAFDWVVADPALPVELPHPHLSDVRRHRLRLVPGARSRVPLVHRAAGNRDRRRWQDRNSLARRATTHGRPHFRLVPAGPAVLRSEQRLPLRRSRARSSSARPTRSAQLRRSFVAIASYDFVSWSDSGGATHNVTALRLRRPTRRPTSPTRLRRRSRSPPRRTVRRSRARSPCRATASDAGGVARCAVQAGRGESGRGGYEQPLPGASGTSNAATLGAAHGDRGRAGRERQHGHLCSDRHHGAEFRRVPGGSVEGRVFPQPHAHGLPDRDPLRERDRQRLGAAAVP